MKKHIIREASLKQLTDKYSNIDPKDIKAVYDADKTPEKQFAILFTTWFDRISRSWPEMIRFDKGLISDIEKTKEIFFKELDLFMTEYLEKRKTFSLSPALFSKCSSPSEAREIVNKYEDITQAVKAGEKKGLGEIVAENNDWIIIHIPTWEASKYFGKIGISGEPPWCIVYSNTAWTKSTYAGDKYYILHKREPLQRFALIVPEVIELASLWPYENYTLAKGLQSCAKTIKQRTGLTIPKINETLGEYNSEKILWLLEQGYENEIWLPIQKTNSKVLLEILDPDTVTDLLLKGVEVPENLLLKYAIIDEDYEGLRDFLFISNNLRTSLYSFTGGKLIKKWDYSFWKGIHQILSYAGVKQQTFTEIRYWAQEYAYKNFLLKSISKIYYEDSNWKIVGLPDDKEIAYDEAFRDTQRAKGVYVIGKGSYKGVYKLFTYDLETVMAGTFIVEPHPIRGLENIEKVIGKVPVDRLKDLGIIDTNVGKESKDAYIRRGISNTDICKKLFENENFIVLALKNDDGRRYFSRIVNATFYANALFAIISFKSVIRSMLLGYNFSDHSFSYATVDGFKKVENKGFEQFTRDTFSPSYDLYRIMKRILIKYLPTGEYLTKSNQESLLTQTENWNVFMAFHYHQKNNLNLLSGFAPKEDEGLYYYFYNRKDIKEKYVLILNDKDCSIFGDDGELVFRHSLDNIDTISEFVEEKFGVKLYYLFTRIKDFVIGDNAIFIDHNGTRYAIVDEHRLFIIGPKGLGTFNINIFELGGNKNTKLIFTSPDIKRTSFDIGEFKEAMTKMDTSRLVLYSIISFLRAYYDRDTVPSFERFINDFFDAPFEELETEYVISGDSYLAANIDADIQVITPNPDDILALLDEDLVRRKNKDSVRKIITKYIDNYVDIFQDNAYDTRLALARIHITEFIPYYTELLKGVYDKFSGNSIILLDNTSSSSSNTAILRSIYVTCFKDLIDFDLIKAQAKEKVEELEMKIIKTFTMTAEDVVSIKGALIKDSIAELPDV